MRLPTFQAAPLSFGDEYRNLCSTSYAVMFTFLLRLIYSQQ